MRPLDPERVVFGQYAGYRDEDGVADDSDVETFVALEAFVDNDRWRDVPFYLRTGKALGDNRRTVTITFRKPAGALFGADGTHRDRLALDLTETPTAVLELNVKKPGPDLTVEPVGSRWLSAERHENDGLDAYERLLLDVLRGDQTLFARADEVDRLWQVCQPVLDHPRGRTITKWARGGPI